MALFMTFFLPRIYSTELTKALETKRFAILTFKIT